MKNLTSIYCIAIYLIAIVLPLCQSLEPVSTAIGVVSGIITIIAFIIDNRQVDNTKYYAFASALDVYQVSQQLTNIEKEIYRIAETLPKQMRIDCKMAQVNVKIHQIDFQHTYVLNIYQQYKNGTKYNPSDMNVITSNLMKCLNSDTDHPYGIVTDIYDILIGSTNLVNEMNILVQGKMGPCTVANNSMSYQQNLQNILASLIVSQAKVSTIARVSAFLLKEFTGDYPVESLKLITGEMAKQALKTLKNFKNLMTDVSRDVWICDPNQHIQNVTYMEMLRVFQKQILETLVFKRDEDKGYNVYNPNRPGINEERLVDEWELKKFSAHPVAFYNEITKEIEHNDDNDPNQTLYAHNLKCNGLLRDCQAANVLLGVQKYDWLAVCMSSSGSSRRFDRIAVHDLSDPDEPRIRKIFGPKKPCDIYHKQYFVPPWTSVCTCQEEKNFNPDISRLPAIVHTHYTHRYFYIADIYANVQHNYVVTGVKIGNRKGVFYPIIQEGQLMKGGIINQTTLRWKDIFVEYGELIDAFLFDSEYVVAIDWEARTVQLGDIDLPDGRFLVGLGFTRGEVDLYSSKELHDVRDPLRLKAISVTVNLTTGTYERDDEIHDPYDKDGPSRFDYINSTMVDIEELPLPDFSFKSNNIVNDGFLNFTTSQFVTDFGQTTIPYIDTQNVTTKVPTLMSGVGLYYKYRDGHAGYLGIKLKTHDTSKLLELPDDTISQLEIKKMLEQISLSNSTSELFVK